MASTGRCSWARTRTRCPSPRTVSALEVLAANGVHVLLDSRRGYTPTPAVSRAILAHNAAGSGPRADGIVVTPSHNPPADGGFKYNPPDGGPAGHRHHRQIQDRANELLAAGLAGRPPDAVRAGPGGRHAPGGSTSSARTCAALEQVVDLDAIRSAGVRIGADPLGGASVAYWGRYRRAVRAGPDRGQPEGGPDLPLHDPRLGRQDPHGLLVAVRDGRPDRADRTSSTWRSATTPTPTGTAS